jgi:hypothetical protein
VIWIALVSVASEKNKDFDGLKKGMLEERVSGQSAKAEMFRRPRICSTI